MWTYQDLIKKYDLLITKHYGGKLLRNIKKGRGRKIAFPVPHLLKLI